MNEPKLVGLMIRARAGAGEALRAMPARAGLRIEPLFENVGKGGLGMAAGEEWLLAREAPAAGSPWDSAHEAVRQLGFAEAEGAAFIEPDLEQEFRASEPAPGLAARGGRGVPDPQDETLPMGPGFAWHLRPDYSQLRAARLAAGGGRGARIAHLDTGYDPEHETKPAHVLEAYGYDFVDGKWGASDPEREGFLKMPGHGTGTLSILAGNQVAELEDGSGDSWLGGAPQAEIIPLRIANSVILFRTSALARALDRAIRPVNQQGEALPPADVITLSMGGVASEAWAQAVNAAYEAGVCMVAAAGNNFSIGIGAFPTRFIVYPARFRRVIAACGVMANRASYSGLRIGRMQGNYGPDSKMATALSAFTPNMSWAEIGAPKVVDMNGQGTSSATPQVAAAAALYIARNRGALQALPEPWQRVEAVRHALFTSATLAARDGHGKLGNGVLQAGDALSIAPSAGLAITAPDTAKLAFFKVLTGLGVREGDGRAAMFAVEAAQLIQLPVAADRPNPFEELVPDPDQPAGQVPEQARVLFIDALRQHPRTSQELKEHLAAVLDSYARPGRPPPPARPPRARKGVPPAPPAAAPPAKATAPAPAVRSRAPAPPERRLRGYAFDPSLQYRMDLSPICTVTYRVPWEENLAPGPSGEYLEVIDHDPASRAFYDPVDLNDPHLLAQDGLAPSESNPQFHQQMVYAVSSLTIRHFEAALGRQAQWAPGPGATPHDDSNFVQQLRIYPHALRNANAYYSPAKKALLFGYFRATTLDPGEHLPGGVVFACLSHDIVAHETAHALLDGMHRRFSEATNADQRAFHEAFADVVALMQHFTFPELARHQIGQTRGDLRTQQNFLGQMATQFGMALGMHGALRNYINTPASPDQYRKATEAHARGAALVAAIFDAFLLVYEARTRDLLRIATGGTGVLPSGALHPDLVSRLADEASKAASHVLRICIRALDYCPAVDLTFGEYLRALITADHDLVSNDRYGYRVAFIDAFRRRGIYPPDVRTLSEDSLLWHGPAVGRRKPSLEFLNGIRFLREFVQRFQLASSRREAFMLARDTRLAFHDWLEKHLRSGQGPQDADFLGIQQGQRFEVHSARYANRVGPDGDLLNQFVVEILQRPGQGGERGCTVLIDVKELHVRYVIRKRVAAGAGAAPGHSLWETYYGARAPEWRQQEPFAVMHRAYRSED